MIPLLLGLVIAGCDSSDPDDEHEFFMRVDVNDETAHNYTNQAALTANFSQSGSTYLGVFTGYDAESNVSLQVYSDGPITTDTYTGYTLSGTSIVGALIGYQDDTGTLYTQGTGASIVSRVTLTEITDSAVRGTFEGRLRANGRPDLLVEGSFRVRRFN